MSDQCSIFVEAVLRGDVLKASLMLQDGLDIDVVHDVSHKTPLFSVIDTNNLEALTLLVEVLGANIRVLSHKHSFFQRQTAIVYAQKHQDCVLADYLIDCLDRADIVRKPHSYCL